MIDFKKAVEVMNINMILGIIVISQLHLINPHEINENLVVKIEDSIPSSECNKTLQSLKVSIKDVALKIM